jgi:hypothetical protein
MKTAVVRFSKFRWTQVQISFCGMLAAITMWSGLTEVSAIIALTTQPAWFITSWRHKQWGVFFNAFVFTALYLGLLYRAVYGGL